MSTGDDFTPATYEESKLVLALHGYPRIDSADTFSLDGDSACFETLAEKTTTSSDRGV